MNFISLACDVFLCFVPLCTIFISSAEAVQEVCFRFYLTPPPSPSKREWSVTKQLWTWPADCSLHFVAGKNYLCFWNQMQLKGISSESEPIELAVANMLFSHTS